jgi:glycerol uptake facilitator-like aquaporin
MKLNKYISEFLGTAFLFCAVVGSGIMGQSLTNDESIILFVNAVITFFALYFLISSFESYSNHFNPVVSLAFFLNKEISFKTFVLFTLLQILGAIIGVLTANIMFDVELFQLSNKNRSGFNIYLSEIIATFGLVFFILISNKDKIALIVASYIGAAYWFTSSTSFANLAGTIGRMFSDSFAGISPENVFSFGLAQIIGSIIAFIVYKYFFKDSL